MYAMCLLGNFELFPVYPFWFLNIYPEIIHVKGKLCRFRKNSDVKVYGVQLWYMIIYMLYTFRTKHNDHGLMIIQDMFLIF